MSACKGSAADKARSSVGQCGGSARSRVSVKVAKCKAAHSVNYLARVSKLYVVAARQRLPSHRRGALHTTPSATDGCGRMTGEILAHDPDKFAELDSTIAISIVVCQHGSHLIVCGIDS
jgi:hypothetical protein